MVTIAVLIAGCVIALVVLLVLIWAGFRGGDFSGESLARALRKDLEAAARDWPARDADDMTPPS